MTLAVYVIVWGCGVVVGWNLCRLYVASRALRILRGSTTPTDSTLIRLGRLVGVKHHGGNRG